jgi:hypothetical protein
MGLPLARVDGLEPQSNDCQQRNGRSSFWERPSRALPDPKGAAAGLTSRLPVVGVVNGRR